MRSHICTQMHANKKTASIGLSTFRLESQYLLTQLDQIPPSVCMQVCASCGLSLMICSTKGTAAAERGHLCI